MPHESPPLEVRLTPERPNFLFILIDCLRSRAVFEPTIGSPIPTLRSFVRRGTAFPNCVATSTTTSPSMGTIFTGTLPFVHGIRSLHGYKLNSDVATLAEIFQSHGYHTHAEATGPVVRQQDFHRGFDVFNHRDAVLYDEAYWRQLQERMMALPSRRPWFFYLHLWELHAPRYLPPGHPGRWRFDRHRYERSLSALDRTRLRRILELAGPDAVVTMTGDHGEIPRFGRSLLATRKLKLKPAYRFLNQRSNHGYHVYEDLVRVPVLMAGPGVAPGRIVPTAVRHMDLFPTLLDLAGIEDDRRRQAMGQSLVPLFHGDGDDRPGYSEAVGVKVGGPEEWLVSVRHRGWKYVKPAVGKQAWLWRLPDERRNLASQYPDVVQEMEWLLTRMGAGASITATGQNLSETESAEVEDHLRELGYLE